MDTSCRECKSVGCVHYDHKEGTLICTKCGTVLEENYIDDTPEWTNFEDDGDSNSRAFVSGKYEPFEKSTLQIVGKTREAKSLAAFQRKLMESDPIHENIKQIEELCGKMDLPTVITEEAKDIYYKYDNEKKKKPTGSKKQKKKKDFILSVIFLACNKTGAGRTIKEISEQNDIDEKVMRKHCKEISSVIPSFGQVMTPSKFIVKFVAELKLPYPVNGLAKKIVEKAVNLMEGKRSTTTASAALCFAIELLGITTCTSGDISRVAKIAENTLKGACKTLRENKSQIVTNEDINEAKSQLDN
eukprot:TRINITY_DN576_c0_g1_i1.p1 TRINITY_DN576_c0_g1~~TRINITY_DN576_c0_g1_i1.p1  ORF type:complete len:311 (+),score=109.04 TRINITY_DN576_c0_g1_i1:32-934(+)